MQNITITQNQMAAAPQRHWGQHRLLLALVIIALSALLAWHAELGLRLVALALGAGALVLLHHQPNQLEPRGRAGFTEIDSVQLHLSPAAAEETRDTAFAAFSERLPDMLLGPQQHNLRIALDSAKNRSAEHPSELQSREKLVCRPHSCATFLPYTTFLRSHQPPRLEPRGRAGFTQIDSVQLDLSPAAAEETRDTAFAAFSERLRDMLLGLQQHNLRIALDSAKNRVLAERTASTARNQEDLSELIFQASDQTSSALQDISARTSNISAMTSRNLDAARASQIQLTQACRHMEQISGVMN